MRAIRIMIVGMLLTAALGCASRRGSERQDDGEYKQLTAYIDSLKVRQAAEAIAAGDFVIGIERASDGGVSYGRLEDEVIIKDQSRNYIEVKGDRFAMELRSKGLKHRFADSGRIQNRKITENKNGDMCFTFEVKIKRSSIIFMTITLLKNSNDVDVQVRDHYMGGLCFISGKLIPSRLATINRGRYVDY